MHTAHTKVSIINTKSYSYQEIKNAVDRHFANLNIDSMLNSSMRVVIKPNLVMKRSPNEATTTHPSLVRAVTEHLEELGITDITIAESPGGLYTKPLLKGIYTSCGISDAAEGTCAKLNYDTSFSDMACTGGQEVSSFPIITPIHNADFIISLPKLKTHCMTTLSGAVKNLFGTIPGLTKPEFHYRFPQTERFCTMLVDLAMTVKPNLTIVDAVDSMEGDGPSAGQKKHTALTFASCDPFTLDVSISKTIGLDPKNVPTVINSMSRSLVLDYTVCGDYNTEPLIKNFLMPRSKTVDFKDNIPAFIRKPALFIMNRIFTPLPSVHRNKCIGCGKCAQSCPAKTITIKNKKANINYKNCIHCFCCHEMCPVRAISVRRSPFSR